MTLYESKRSLRQKIEEYRAALHRLVMENRRLARELAQAQAAIKVYRKRAENTRQFLAVLQGEQIASTTHD